MSISIVEGDLLEASEEYIGHQCNCVTIGNGAGLAKFLFKKFPYANTYAHRKAPSEPGSYSIHGDGKADRLIVNFYSQYHPGKAKQKPDTRQARLEWLLSAMERFIRDQKVSELALPHGIGCGLAGGDWEVYWKSLAQFADAHEVTIKLYRLDLAS